LQDIPEAKGSECVIVTDQTEAMMTFDWFKSEREKWASPRDTAIFDPQIGLPALDDASRELFEKALPRDVLMPRLEPDRKRINTWMAASDLLQQAFVPGQIILGKFAHRYIGHLDDRPMVTAAGARAGKTSTVLEPNLYLYPGSMLVLDPKGELSRTAMFRRALGHDVHVLDPFGGSSASFNALAELNPESIEIIDDVLALANALIVDEGDARSRHWNESAKTLLLGIILLTLTLESGERNLVTVRELLTLTYPPLVRALRRKAEQARSDPNSEKHFDQHRFGVEKLLEAMACKEGLFGGILMAIGNRFLGTPHNERGSIFSTAATQTSFLDSLPLRKISRRSSFRLASLRGDRPTTIYLSLPVGRMESHFRWLRLIVQMACTVLEQMGTYPRDRPPILFMMEEFATLGHMEIMERAAAYFPGFGVKLWAILQDVTQLQRYYKTSWETFLGNAGLVQCFANGDEATLSYIAHRLDNLIAPFELRTAFSRRRFSQLLLMEGLPPAAALRLGHEDVAAIRSRVREAGGPALSRAVLPPPKRR
jgi:type IV secretion system protein VirD4